MAEPAVVRTCTVQKLSFTASGMPSSGPSACARCSGEGGVRAEKTVDGAAWPTSASPHRVLNHHVTHLASDLPLTESREKPNRLSGFEKPALRKQPQKAQTRLDREVSARWVYHTLAACAGNRNPPHCVAGEGLGRGSSPHLALGPTLVACGGGGSGGVEGLGDVGVQRPSALQVASAV